MSLLALANRKRAVAVGAERLIGSAGVARSALDSNGFVAVHGERWQATASRPLAEGESIIVTGRNGLHLTVRPASEPEHNDSASG